MYRQDKPRRISYSVSSGANNIGLGVTLTTLFFPGEVNVFFIIAQLSWIFMLIPMRYFYAGTRQRTKIKAIKSKDYSGSNI